MQEHGIPSPEKVVLTFEIEIIYNSRVYEVASDVLEDVFENVSNAARREAGYLHFNVVTLTKIAQPKSDS